MIWDQYLRLCLLLLVAAWVSSSVIGQGGQITVLLALWILGRLWLVQKPRDIPPVLRRSRERSGPNKP